MMGDELVRNEVIINLLGRRSIRSFKSDPIDERQLKTILEAALYAPSGHGSQSVRLIVITDPGVKKKLSKANAAILGTKGDPFYGAPVIVAVLADKKAADYVYDGSVAIMNMMNAAFSLGIGSCWVHRAKQEFESDEGKELLKEWGLDDGFEGIGHCVLGYPMGIIPKAAPRKPGRIIYVK